MLSRLPLRSMLATNLEAHLFRRVMDRTWESFSKFDHPLVYTPGDNEWTDCHREAAGGMDPLERLDALRERFFAGSSTLGGGSSLDLMVQSDDPEWARFVENRLWIVDEVVFGTLHLVGSGNNNQEEVPGAVAEFRERDAANEEWLSNIFELAMARKAPWTLFVHARQSIRQFGRGRLETGIHSLFDTVKRAGDRLWRTCASCSWRFSCVSDGQAIEAVGIQP